MGPVIERLLADAALDAAKLSEGQEIADGAGLPLVRVLLHMKLVEPAAVAAALSAVTGRNVVHLDKFALPPAPVASFPAALCRELRVLPLAFEAGLEGLQLVLAMSDPTDESAGSRVAELIGKNVRPLLVDDAALSRAIAKRYEEQPPIRPPRPPAPAGATQVDGEVLLLEEVDEPSKTDPTPPRTMTTSVERFASMRSDPHPSIIDPSGEVFAQLTDAPVERTVIMRAPSAPSVPPRDRTVMKRNPFLDPISASGATEMRSIIGDARVCFVSRDARARLRVAADLAPVVHDAVVVDDLKRASEIVEKEEFDEIVLHNPKLEPQTRGFIDRMAKALQHGVVVISSEPAFSDMPSVRRRIAPPATAAEIAGLILDGLFAANEDLP